MRKYNITGKGKKMLRIMSIPTHTLFPVGLVNADFCSNIARCSCRIPHRTREHPSRARTAAYCSSCVSVMQVSTRQRCRGGWADGTRQTRVCELSVDVQTTDGVVVHVCARPR